MGYLLFQHFFPAAVYRKSYKDIALTVKAVRQEDTAQKKVRCGGQLGSLHISGPLIGAEVYSRGLVIKPLFMPPFAILADEMKSVKVKQGFWDKGVEIEHTSPQVNNPIRLRCENDKAFCFALESLVP